MPLNNELLAIRDLALSIKQNYEQTLEQEKPFVLILTLSAINTCFRIALSLEPIPSDDQILNDDRFDKIEQSIDHHPQNNIVTSCHSVLDLSLPQKQPIDYFFMDNYLLIAQIAECLAYIIKEKYKLEEKTLENIIAYEKELKNILNILDKLVKANCNIYIFDLEAWEQSKTNIKQLLNEPSEKSAELIMPFLPFWMGLEVNQNLSDDCNDHLDNSSVTVQVPPSLRAKRSNPS